MKLPAYNPDPEYVAKLIESCGFEKRNPKTGGKPDKGQTAAAKALGVSPRTVRNWVTTEAKGIDISRAQQLALLYIAHLNKRASK